MAQQQPRRDDLFQNIPRTTDERDRDRECERDVRKNDAFGTRSAADPVAPYAYGNTGSAAGFGAPAGGATGAGMADYGTTGYESTNTTQYDTTGTAPGYGVALGANTRATTGHGTAGGGGGQWGREANTDRGGNTGRNRNMGRDQK